MNMEKKLNAPVLLLNNNPFLSVGYQPLTNMWECFTSVEDTMEKMGMIPSLQKINIENNYTNFLDTINGIDKSVRYKYLTELYMVLNYKIWEHHDRGNDEIGMLYDSLWRKCGQYCDDSMSGKELEYFYATID